MVYAGGISQGGHAPLYYTTFNNVNQVHDDTQLVP